MYYFTKSIGFFVSLSLFFAGSVFAQSNAAVEVVNKPEVAAVTIRAAGDSRFEFEGNNIIVAYWGGVELDYFGYFLQAEDLRYNKVAQQGTLEGNVVIKSKGLEIKCAKVELDAASGILTIYGAISGSISSPQLTFNAGQARLSFAPGETVDELSDITIELTGRVSVETQAGLHFSSSGFTFNGATSELACLGSFNITAASLAMQSSAGDPGNGITNLTVTGESFTGQIDPNGFIQSAEIKMLDIVSREVFLQADLATISAHPSDSEPDGWDIVVAGNPLSGGVHQERHDISFTTTSAELAIGQLGLETLEMAGGIDVVLEDSTLHAERVNVERTADGYKLGFPGELMVTFDLFESSGGKLAAGGAIEQWLGS